jgi:hypothetical protein
MQGEDRAGITGWRNIGLGKRKRRQTRRYEGSGRKSKTRKGQFRRPAIRRINGDKVDTV